MPGQANLIDDHKHLIADIASQLNGECLAAVVLDTLNKSLIGSESKDADMSAYIRAAEAIREKFSCVVIIVHHCGHDETRPRGHSSLPAAVDAQLAVTRDRGSMQIQVEVEMMRDGPEGTIVQSVLVPVEVGKDINGKPLTSLVVQPIDPSSPSHASAAALTHWPRPLAVFRAALCEAINSLGQRCVVRGGHIVLGVNVDVVRDEYYKRCFADDDTTEEKQDTRRRRFKRCLEHAQRAHLIGLDVNEATQAQTVWLARAAEEAELSSPPLSSDDNGNEEGDDDTGNSR
jgi:AAA domain